MSNFVQEVHDRVVKARAHVAAGKGGMFARVGVIADADGVQALRAALSPEEFETLEIESPGQAERAAWQALANDIRALD